MEEMEHKVRRTIEEYHMLSPGDRVIAAVSGGADPICLLALSYGMKEEWDLQLRAVHVYHGLREQGADRNADFVRTLCAELNVPYHIIRVDVCRFVSGPNMSEEEARCHLRYKTLEQEAQGQESGDKDRARIAIAHHSNDQAETILHNISRGSELAGLKGIPHVRRRIIRPLLDADRREITDWLRKNGFSWVQDSTNTSGHYTHNRIHRLPLMIEENINQGAVENILRTGRLAGQADEYLSVKRKCQIGEYVKRPGPQAAVPYTVLTTEPEIIRSYVVMELLESLAGSAEDLEWIHVQQVLGLTGRPIGKEVHLPCSLMTVREYKSTLIGRNTSPGEEEEGEMALPKVGMSIFSYRKGTQFPKNTYTKWFGYDRIKGTPVVRARRPEDYMTLADGNHKVLKRFIIDERIPRQLQDQVPPLADDSHVMWIIGYRISEFYKIGPNTTWILQAEAGRRKE